jgi:hypothetical protein
MAQYWWRSVTVYGSNGTSHTTAAAAAQGPEVMIYIIITTVFEVLPPSFIHRFFLNEDGGIKGNRLTKLNALSISTMYKFD